MKRLFAVAALLAVGVCMLVGCSTGSDKNVVNSVPATVSYEEKMQIYTNLDDSQGLEVYAWKYQYKLYCGIRSNIGGIIDYEEIMELKSRPVTLTEMVEILDYYDKNDVRFYGGENLTEEDRNTIITTLGIRESDSLLQTTANASE